MKDQESHEHFEQLVREAMQASQADDGARALQLLAEAMQCEPRSGVPHLLAGSEYAAMGRMDVAEAALANAVLLAPELSIARYQLGLLQFSSGRAAVALLTWEPLLSLPDTGPLPHFVRGFAALAQDDFGLAVSHYREGLSRNHDNPALTSDIEKVLRGIAEVQGRRELPDAAPASADADSAGKHVLLSGYRQLH